LTNLRIRVFPSAKTFINVEDKIYKIAQSIEAVLLAKGWSVAAAESCTGGRIAAALTAVPGSSACFKGGVVAYAEEVKVRLLGVLPKTLNEEGVVSELTVVEMARGVMQSMNTDLAVATTGMAGPSGGTEKIPVGTIWVAAISHNEMRTYCIRHFDRGREENTRNAVLVALEVLREIVKKEEFQS